MKKYISIILIAAIAFSYGFFIIAENNSSYRPRLYTVENGMNGERYSINSIPAFDTPVIMYSNEEYVIPKIHNIRHKVWDVRYPDGWDNTSYQYTLQPDSTAPTIIYDDDFVLYTNDRVLLQNCRLSDEMGKDYYWGQKMGFEIIDDIPAGTYYLYVTVQTRGRYVYQGRGYETRQDVCVYKLIVE